MQKISELLNITITEGDPLIIYHPIFKDKIVYHEFSSGFWYKYEYDSNGNEINQKNSYGYWDKCEYDLNNNEIYYEDSDGDWEKYEFDSNSNLIYHENNNGIIIDNRTTELIFRSNS